MRDLLMTIVVVDDLIDFRFVNASSSELKKSKEGKKSHSSRDSEKKNNSQNKTKQGNP